MSAAPFDVQPVIERLRERVKALRQVAGSADYANVKSLADFPAPCAYVVLAKESPDLTTTGNAPRGQQIRVSQIVQVTFGVVVVVRNYREQRGDQVKEELKAMLGACRGTLLGWVPDVAGARPCQLARGDLNDYNAGTALWTDVWRTQHTITTEATT